jgi:hypothetical protein
MAVAGPDEDKPIVSLLADNPLARPRIEAFVLALSDSVDALQDLEQAADFGEITRRVRSLAYDSHTYGFPPLAAAAEEVVGAAALRDRKRVRDTLLVLTDVSRLVRLGHRGSAPAGF